MSKLFLLLIILMLPVFLIGILFSNQTKAQEDGHVSGQILVKFKDNVPERGKANSLKAQGAKVVSEIKGLGVSVVKVSENAREKVLAALSKDPNVEYAENDYIATAFFIPDDPYFPNQWGLMNASSSASINAPPAWDKTTGAGILVAVLDTGVSKNHPDVASKVNLRANFSDSLTDDDVYGHGTHVGGIIAALTNNGMGVAGGCPDCMLLSGKVLNDSGSGAYSWIANGITWAVANKAKVINLSLGGSIKSRTLENAVNFAWNNGVVVVAAAGNSGNQSKTYPAAYTNAIAVAATDNLDKKAYFSEYGSWVDVAAPGVNIYSAWNDNSSPSNPQPVCLSIYECYKYASGTSMATPMVSAVAALIWSNPAFGTSAQSVRNRLESTADKITGTGSYWVWGRINAAKAVGAQ